MGYECVSKIVDGMREVVCGLDDDESNRLKHLHYSCEKVNDKIVVFYVNGTARAKLRL